jgi:hypothetical protein
MSIKHDNCKNKKENGWRWRWQSLGVIDDNDNNRGRRCSRSIYRTVTIAMLTILSLLSSTLVNTIDVNAQRNTKFMLSIEPMAPKLPADNGEYYAVIQLQTVNKKPIHAPYDMEIDLVSSDPLVISVPSKITIKEGQTYVKIDLKTTEKAGIATINALISNVTVGSTTIETTRTKSVEPVKLAVYAAPDKILADPRLTGKVYVQLLNANGLPVSTDRPLVVNIASSNNDIAKVVTDKIVIDKGKSGMFIDYIPGVKRGSAKIVASAFGLESASTTITTVDITGNRLALDIAPGVVPAEKRVRVILTVQVIDERGLPAKPLEDTVVTLTSSHSNVISVPKNITIKADQYYVHVTAEAGGELPPANEKVIITASAPGYESAFMEVNIASPITDNIEVEQCKDIGLYVTPSKLPPDNNKHSVIVAQLQKKVGNKDIPCLQKKEFIDLKVMLTSSNLDIGEVEEMLRIPYNSYYGVASFSTKFVSGHTIITGTQTDYNTAQTTLEVVGPLPKSLRLMQIPNNIEADDKKHNALVVQVLDDIGNPVLVPADTLIELTSSNQSVATMSSPVTIRAGNNYIIAEVKTTLEPGSVDVTASAEGLTSHSIKFNTVSTRYTKIAVYVVPRTLLADGETYQCIVVQLQDADGNPIAASSNIPIIISSSSMLGGYINNKDIMIKAGSSYAIGEFTTSTTPDRTIITASATGFNTTSTELSIVLQEFKYIVSDIPNRLSGLEGIPIRVTVSVDDIPINNALVQVSGLYAETNSAVTSGSGEAEIVYKPTAGGNNNVILTISKKGYNTITKSFNIFIEQPIRMTIKAVTSGGKVVDVSINVVVKSLTPGGTNYNIEASKDKPALLDRIQRGVYRISMPEEISTSNAVYKFVRWSDGTSDNPRDINIIYDAELVAIYSAKYLLQATSPFGNVVGNGWYAEGSKAYLSIEPTNITDILIIDRKFTGWRGDVYSTSDSIEIVMDSPKHVTAEWSIDYTKIFLMTGAGTGGVGFFVYRSIKKREEIKKKLPDLDWFKKE